MISGVYIQDGMTMSDLEYDFISNLINLSLEKKDIASLGFDEYLKTEWDLYRQNKDEIVLDLFALDHGFKSLYKIIVFNVVRNEHQTPKDNVFKPEWISIFPSLQSVMILDHGGDYKFDLKVLLESMQSISPSITVSVIDKGKWTAKALTDKVSAEFCENGWDIEYGGGLVFHVPGWGVEKGGLLIKSLQK